MASAGAQVEADEIKALEGKALRRLRDDAGLTQEDLGARSGVNKKQISRYEGGKTMPGARNLARLLSAIGATALDHALALAEQASVEQGVIGEGGSVPFKTHMLGPASRQEEPVRIHLKELSIEVSREQLDIMLPEDLGRRRRKRPRP